ncbi:amidophosphoribosyltransferase [Thermomicrobium sp. 4228-Ro]|uniref:amidophosphoribosyltransferase n=1 Tax=Thermomicrobium sp. 4228-Ro TaxID=2993937 RepID=UPI002248CF7C|nr:amidophosphoribosyltransferase [Thermomicrobium sp. 4228-Ro]MCX2726156.1 amidophosphoribosyltransferase [Thermomicrobium sp. 4228-Ro]
MTGPREACGVFGVFAPGEDVARLTFFGLYALQHRGQESAGIATSDGERISLHRRMGLVSSAFTEEDLRDLRGHIAVGHTRYSTTGSSVPVNAGPFVVAEAGEAIAVSHNGNLVNGEDLRRELLDAGIRLESTTDTEALAWTILRARGGTWPERIRQAMERLVGAYSLAILTRESLIAVRDPLGIRPLCLGRLDTGWVVASETCALATIGAEFVREVDPGEIIVIGEHGVASYPAPELAPEQAMCVFEFIYFARPDSAIMGQRLHVVRQRMGAELWREHPADADLVVPLPDSAVPAAIGYSLASGIPYAEALIKNRYIGRTFIQPDQRLREQGVKLKFNALPEVLEGKRVVLVDDTIVRGTTSRPIVELLKQNGAREVHMRVHSPPIRWPCHLGVDMATREELIAAHLSVEEIGQAIGADSIGYLSLEGLFRAIGLPADRFCAACLTGRYPVPIPPEHFQRRLGRRVEPVVARS